MKKDTVAIILAAGGGKRFWPFVTDKNLFPFFGRPYIDYTVTDTMPPDIGEMIVVTNEKNTAAFSGRKMPVPHTVVVQKAGDGMAHAIIAARALLSGKQLLVVIADDLADRDVYRTVLEKAGHRFFGVLPVWRTDRYFPGGYIAFDGKKPSGIVEKPEPGKEPSRFVYFGGQYLESADALLDALSAVKSERDDLYEQALSKLMQTQEFATVPFEEPFVSLKYPWHVLSVMDFLLKHRMTPGKGKKVEIGNNVMIEGPVYIGNNVRIMENTKIVGPVYIGDDTIIGNNNIIRESHIGKGCVTGFNTDITRSYIGDHCWFHSNYIGDSILEGNVSMGSGSVLANLRLDEKEIGSTVRGARVGSGRTKLGAMIAANVRIGVNVSVMPGVKIGSGSMVGAGITLDADLPEQSFAVAKGGYTVRPNTAAIADPHARQDFRNKI